jgi:hypothetical protein
LTTADCRTDGFSELWMKQRRAVFCCARQAHNCCLAIADWLHPEGLYDLRGKLFTKLRPDREQIRQIVLVLARERVAQDCHGGDPGQRRTGCASFVGADPFVDQNGLSDMHHATSCNGMATGTVLICPKISAAGSTAAKRPIARRMAPLGASVISNIHPAKGGAVLMFA